MLKRIQTTKEYKVKGDVITQKTEQLYIFGFKYGGSKIISTDKKPIVYDKIIPTDKFGHPFVLEIGSKTINKSDGSDSYWIGEVIRFDDLDGKYSGTKRAQALPIIRDEDRREYTTFGICLPYNEELIKILKYLKPMEQWNLLCRDHCQVGENNGEIYSTYPVGSRSALIQWYKDNSKKMYRV